MIGPAVILLVNESSRMFVAERARLENGTITATGRFERKATPNYAAHEYVGPTVTRSWPMEAIRDVRWGGGVLDAQEAA